MIWQTRWGPKCRQLTRGRIKKHRTSFMRQKLTHTHTKSPGKTKATQRDTRQSASKSTNQWKLKEHKSETYQQGDIGEKTLGGITGEDRTNWQRHEGEQRPGSTSTNFISLLILWLPRQWGFFLKRVVRVILLFGSPIQSCERGFDSLPGLSDFKSWCKSGQISLYSLLGKLLEPPG